MLNSLTTLNDFWAMTWGQNELVVDEMILVCSGFSSGSLRSGFSSGSLRSGFSSGSLRSGFSSGSLRSEFSSGSLSIRRCFLSHNPYWKLHKMILLYTNSLPINLVLTFFRLEEARPQNGLKIISSFWIFKK